MDNTIKLQKFREKIDNLDQHILSLIADRINICREVADYKKKNSIPMMQPERINQVIKKCIQMGDRLQLSSEFITKIYQEIIAEACRVEDTVIKG